jgi:hypothetical protein
MRIIIALFLYAVSFAATALDLQLSVSASRGVVCSDNRAVYFGNFRTASQAVPAVKQIQCSEQAHSLSSPHSSEAQAATWVRLKLKDDSPHRERFIGFGYRVRLEEYRSAQFRVRGGGAWLMYRHQFYTF